MPTSGRQVKLRFLILSEDIESDKIKNLIDRLKKC